MPHTPPFAARGVRSRAAGAAAATCPVGRGGAIIAAISELTQLSDRFDVLLRDAACVTSQREYDRLADEAHAIADGLNAAFRGQGTPQNAPRWQRGGKAAW